MSTTSIDGTVGRPERIAAWATTGLFAALMALSGTLYLIGPAPIVGALHELGYPLYFSKLLGIAKLLGVAALLVPGWPRLCEWAYAGFFFDLIAGIVSHLVTTGASSHVLPAVAAFALLNASYFLRRRTALEASS